MNVKVDDAGPCRKVLRIEIPAEKVSQEMQEVVAAYARGARIPGFRQGKAPRNLVQRHYAKEIDEELKERLVGQGYHAALEEKKISPVAVLGVHDVSLLEGAPMSFSVTLDVPPEFTLPDYRKIPLQGRKIEVSDKDVDDTIARILEQNAKWNEVSGRSVQKGDLVQIDYEGICDGKPVEELAPKAAGLGKGKDFWMLADENAFLPGFGDGLLGAAIGEKKQVLVNFPADFVEKAVAGRKATYFVDVKALREKALPKLDEELLKQMGIESEETLRSQIREDLQHVGEGGEKRRLKGEIVKFLLEKTNLDVPESVVAQETRDAVYDMVRENSHRGVSKQEIEGNKEEIFEAASRSANEKVKVRYILHRIATQEKIEAAPEEVDGRLAELAGRHNMPPAELKAELEKRNSMDDVVEEIRINKALDFVLAQAQVTT